MGQAKRRREAIKKSMTDGSLWVWYPQEHQGDPMFGTFEAVADAIAHHLAQTKLFGDIPIHLFGIAEQLGDKLEEKIQEAAKPILAEIRESCEKQGNFEFDHIRDGDGDLIDCAELKRLPPNHSTSMMHPLQ
jgi:hypothetical protein